MRRSGGAVAGVQRVLHSRWTQWIAGIVVVAVAAAGMIVWRGVPTQQTDLSSPSVWSVNARGPLYGQVNTDITELGAIHAGDPSAFKISGVLQSGSDVVLYSDQQKLRVVDPANPVSVDDPDDVTSAPFDADVIVPAGDYVAFLNRKTGALGAESIADLAVGDSPAQINQRKGDETEQFVAGAVTDKGQLFGLNSAEELVVFDVETGRETSRRSVDGPAAAEQADMTVFGDHWAVIDRGDDASTLWIDGAQIDEPLGAKARLAVADSAAAQLAVADETGLRTFDSHGAAGSIRVDAQGAPAAPVWEQGCVHASWGTGSSVTVSDCGADAEALEFPSDSGVSAGQPVFRRNNGGFVLNDVASGLIWQRESDEWALVPSSVSWQREDDQEETTDAQQNQDARQNECPIPAVGANAEFGVRPGQLTTVPVLVSALDPNPQDTISIVPTSDSPKWNAGNLGELSIVNDDQAIALSPMTADGSATIGYVITDGSDCRVNAEAKVTVHPENVNAAPEYRAVNDQSLANLQVAPGGSLRFNGLSGWVDPDGDPVYVTGATTSAGTAAATPSGMIAYKADDDQPAGRVVITVEVSDGRGGVANRDVAVTVAESPLLKARSFSRTITVGASPSIDLSEYISGIAGGGVENTRVELTRATVDESLQAKISVQPSSDSLSVSVTANEAGVYPITYEVRSGASQATATLLVTASEAENKLSTPPITVFLRPDEDVTVDPLKAVSNPGGRVLMVGDGQQYALDDPRGALNASAVGGSSLRVSGQTPDKRPGRIGTFTYAVTDGAQTITGQAIVFQLDEHASTKPVAVADQVTVRAGGQLDIPVIDNDVAPAGGTLMLDPRQTTDDTPGLAFPSGSVLRYLATETPGSYTLTYRVYSAGHPGEGSLGRVNVRVTSDDGNRAPDPTNIDARVEARSSTLITVPSYGIDPDGDDVSVVSVSQPDRGGSAQVLADGRIQVSSTDEQGPIEFDYTVADARGSTATARMRVGVITDTALAPIAYNDYIEATPGTAEVALDPTLNDSRVGDEKLELQSVDEVASAAADGDHGDRQPAVDGNSVTLHPTNVGKTIYRYTVRSAGGSTAVGTVVLNVTNEALPQYPVLVDTKIGTSEIDEDRFSADVVTNKLVWSGADLTVELRNAPDGVTLNGNEISGPLTDSRQIIPISVTAPQADGQQQAPQTWAFVRVPKKDTIRPQLKDPSKVYEVHEQQQVSVSLGDEIGRLSGRSLQVNSARASGARQAATCSASGTTVTYAAGGDSEIERDTCSVEVQWSGDDGTRTTVSLPMKITLDNPPPELRSQQIGVVAPAETKTLELVDAVQWSDDKGKLGFQCGPASGTTGVTVSCAGSSATVTVAPDAQQGSVAGFDVQIVSPAFTPLPNARLTVQVGTLPPQTLSPVGLSIDVSEGDGGSASGSVDALASNGSVSKYRPVELTGVSFAGATGVTGSANGSSISVQVSANTAGGVKTGTYEVRDAQGNTGQGRIEVNYKARPNKPTAMLASAGDGTVTIQVTDNSALSTPAVTGFKVTSDTGPGTTCPVNGTCIVSGLKNFEKTTFTVASVNSVGESRETASVVGWAYKKPSGTPSIDWEPSANGKVTVAVVNSDVEGTSGITLTGAGTHSMPAGGGTVTLDVGNGISTVITATATGQEKPLVGNSSARDTASSTATVYGVGAPTISRPEAAVKSATALSAQATVTPNGGDAVIGWFLDSGSCSPSQAANGSVSTTVEASSNTPHTITLCAAAQFQGKTLSWTSVAETSNSVTPLKYPSGVQGVTYRVDSTGTVQLNEPDNNVGPFRPARPSAAPAAGGPYAVTFQWEYTGEGGGTQEAGSASCAGGPCYLATVSASGWHGQQHVAEGSAFAIPEASTNAAPGDFLKTVEYWKTGGLAQNLDGQTSIALDPGTYTFTVSFTFEGNLQGMADIEKTLTVIVDEKPEPDPEPDSGGNDSGGNDSGAGGSPTTP